MRSINQSSFLKILSGHDYEFLINGFSFKLSEDVQISNSVFNSLHILKFVQSRFKSIYFSDIKLSSRVVFYECTFDSIKIESSSINSIEFKNCIIDKLIVSENKDIEEILIGGSKINNINIIGNNKLEVLHIGCDNLLDQATVKNNGKENSGQSRFFLCPELFNDIEIDSLTTSLFEIGTFGQFSNLRIDNITSDQVVFKNCFDYSAKVKLGNFKPLSDQKSILRITDSYLSSSNFDNDFLTRQNIFLELENSTIDYNLSRLVP
jgi:hypothetical protein